MKKAVIASILAGGMWGISAPAMQQPTVAQSLPSVQPAAATVNSAKLELLDAGAEPRRELKFRPIVNTKQTMTMTMDMAMEMKIGETPLPKTPIPKMVMKIDALVNQVDPSGDIHCSFGYGDIQVVAQPDTSPEMLAAMKKSLKSLVGIKLDLVIGSDGQLKRKNLILPKTIDPTMKKMLEQFDRSMEQLSTQLPTGMVGLGARWRTNDAIQVSGIQFVQTATYKIVELNDTGMTVETQISQSAPPQDLAIPGASKDLKGRITSIVSGGEGRYVMLFNSLLPISGKSSTLTDSKMSIQTSSKESPTNLSISISIDLNVGSK
jgi:hypothetical protein